MSDTDTLDRPEIEAKTADTSTALAKRRDKRSSAIDVTGKSVTIDGEKFDLTKMPAPVYDYLVLLGLKVHLMASDSPAAAFTMLVSGQIPDARGPAKVKELDPWRLAYAHAVVEETKKSSEPVALDAAKEMATKLDAAALAKIKRLPNVVKHHHRLSGAAAVSLTALVA